MTIVTFDADFYDLSLLKGHPSKIIWLRTGNKTTNNLKEILLKNADIVKSFVNDSENSGFGCLEIK